MIKRFSHLSASGFILGVGVVVRYVLLYTSLIKSTSG